MNLVAVLNKNSITWENLTSHYNSKMINRNTLPLMLAMRLMTLIDRLISRLALMRETISTRKSRNYSHRKPMQKDKVSSRPSNPFLFKLLKNRLLEGISSAFLFSTKNINLTPKKMMMKRKATDCRNIWLWETPPQSLKSRLTKRSESLMKQMITLLKYLR